MKRLLLIHICLLFATVSSSAQQVADNNFQFPHFIPAYQSQKGPMILLDEVHQNEGLFTNGYRPFRELLEKDGYRTDILRGRLSTAKLKRANLLVIINALSLNNAGKWHLPIYPAFTHREIKVIRKWVNKGGALLLAADHMPFPAAAADLAAGFGIQFTNGFAIDTNNLGSIGVQEI